jgi:hypothetical protein
MDDSRRRVNPPLIEAAMYSPVRIALAATSAVATAVTAAGPQDGCNKPNSAINNASEP